MNANLDTADHSHSWIAVDFDGTLAHYDGFKGATVLGLPITPMLARVCAWLEEGRDVRIFTARADQPESVEAIKLWCLEHIGVAIPVTNMKDRWMHQLWDDRAIQVEKNTGRRMDGAL